MFGVKSDKPRQHNESENKTEGGDSTINSDLTTDAELTTSVSGKDKLDDDVIFELLKESRRRKALEYLDTKGGESTIGELAEFIAAEENGTDVSKISSDQRKRVYVGLYQCHLPKLAEGNVIEYDRSRGLIKLGSNACDLLSYLHFNPNENRSPSGVLARWIGEI